MLVVPRQPREDAPAVGTGVERLVRVGIVTVSCRPSQVRLNDRFGRQRLGYAEQQIDSAPVLAFGQPFVLLMSSLAPPMPNA